jgi:hypothetical protein
MDNHVDKLKPALVAVACAIAGTIVAIGLAAAGHGWLEPMFYFSLPMFVLCPLAAVRRADPDLCGASVWLDALLLGAAVAANSIMLSTYLQYYLTASYNGAPIQAALVIGWLCLWYSWQVNAAIAARSRLIVGEKNVVVALWPELLLIIGGTMGNIVVAKSFSAELRDSGLTIWTALAAIMSAFWLRWQIRLVWNVRAVLRFSSDKSSR